MENKLNKIIRDWVNKIITAEEAMQKVHKLNNLEFKEDEDERYM